MLKRFDVEMTSPAQAAVRLPVDTVRRFNRFYTRQIGVLHEGLLESQFSLTEVRLLYEIAHSDKLTAAELCKELGLDPGYVSRILRRFEKQSLLRRVSSAADGRERHLELTKEGQETFAALDARQNEQVATVLRGLSPFGQKRLVEAMRVIEGLLGTKAEQNKTPAYLLRPHQPGDMGWVVHRHGVLYAQQYGYDEHFEALVANIAAEFIQNYDPKRERCWIAEKDGEIVGSVFLVKKSKT